MTREERTIVLFLLLGVALGSWVEEASLDGSGRPAISDTTGVVVVDLFPIDLNHAPAELLEELPGIGPAKAAAIVAYRDAHGPFASVDGLQEVHGIGPRTVDRMRELITVASGSGTSDWESNRIVERTP